MFATTGSEIPIGGTRYQSNRIGGILKGLSSVGTFSASAGRHDSNWHFEAERKQFGVAVDGCR
jgi:hypothetical protein